MCSELVGQIVLPFLAGGSVGYIRCPKALTWSRIHNFFLLLGLVKVDNDVFPWYYIIFTNLVSLQTKSRPVVAEICCNMVIAKKNYKMFFAHQCIQEK